MEIGLGVLKFPPDVFWNMTLGEFLAAMDGHSESLGGKSKPKVLPADDKARLLSFARSLKPTSSLKRSHDNR